ncbi:hypothetical protein HK101_004104 [Irineochytrium annulatum]|nr:hypothetical protein HK101_004104 [Irineochytrium annulatum]
MTRPICRAILAPQRSRPSRSTPSWRFSSATTTSIRPYVSVIRPPRRPAPWHPKSPSALEAPRPPPRADVLPEGGAGDCGVLESDGSVANGGANNGTADGKRGGEGKRHRAERMHWLERKKMMRDLYGKPAVEYENFERTPYPKKLMGRTFDSGFVDLKWIAVTSGSGGDGAITFYKSAQKPMGPPSGGNGAKGGDVYIEASKEVSSLGGVMGRYRAKDGGNGASKVMHGAVGDDLIIRVPLGTMVKQVDSNEAIHLKRVERKKKEEMEEASPGGEMVVEGMIEEQAAEVVAEGMEVKALSDGSRTRLKMIPKTLEEMDDEEYEQELERERAREQEEAQSEREEQARRESTNEDLRDFQRRMKEEYRAEQQSRAKQEQRRVADEAKAEEELALMDRHFKFKGDYIPLADRMALLHTFIPPPQPPSPPINIELLNHGDRHLLVRGGRRGVGNPHFALHDIKGPPIAARGEPGRTIWLELELKTIADAGLVGLPNAGKSTLLGAISNAHPKIAPYPFTTLNPYIGTIDYSDFWSMTVADIPGLVEGAHMDYGLGHTFLRHVERSSVLVYVIDLSGADPARDLRVLRRELELYKKGLPDKRSLVIANKADLRERASSNLEALVKEAGEEVVVVPVSARERKNILTATAALRELVEVERRIKDEAMASTGNIS